MSLFTFMGKLSSRFPNKTMSCNLYTTELLSDTNTRMQNALLIDRISGYFKLLFEFSGC